MQRTRSGWGSLPRKMMVATWLVTPVVLLGLHYGPGQRTLAADRVKASVALAQDAEATQDWAKAAAAWREAIAAVPEQDKDQRVRLTLKYQMARVMHGELPQALEETAALLDQARAWKVGEPVERELRADLGAMHYWAAWLMRLEGAASGEWEPVADQARQHFRFLAETEPTGADAQKKNLESTVRLIRMDLSELQGLPLPKECKGCKDCSGKCKSQREGRCKSENLSDQKKDGRKQVQEQKTKSAGVYNRSNEAGW
jgi:hypothetical protein